MFNIKDFYKTAYNVIALIIYYHFKRYATANHKEGTQQIYALFITMIVFAISATSDRRCTFQLTRKQEALLIEYNQVNGNALDKQVVEHELQELRICPWEHKRPGQRYLYLTFVTMIAFVISASVVDERLQLTGHSLFRQNPFNRLLLGSLM